MMATFFKNRFPALLAAIVLVMLVATACTVDGYTDEPESSTTNGGSTTSSFAESTTGTEYTTEQEETTETEFSTGSETTTAATTKKPATTTKQATTTKPQKPNIGDELRGVWVSYLELNTIFKGKTVEQAKSNIDSIMINSKALGLNAVIFHVRSHSDAFYKSTKFPYAAGAKSLIDAGFDPLAYAIDSAHSRGLELHAWINPYRVGTSDSFWKSKGFELNKDYVKSGNMYYFNPASSKAKDLIISGIEEIIKNYDVDGIHFDDYFYHTDANIFPSKTPGAIEKAQYEAEKSKLGINDIGTWRRYKVSELVKAAYTATHKRSGCVFGVSPRGARPKNGTDPNRDIVYAAVELWMKIKGYIDYICPQIYFGFQNKNQPFDKVVDYWISLNRDSSVKLYIGLALYKIGWVSDSNADTGKEEWKNRNDIMKRSMLYVRSKAECSGVMFFRYDFFFPSKMAESSSWVKSVAIKEVENLLTVMKP